MLIGEKYPETEMISIHIVFIALSDPPLLTWLHFSPNMDK